MGLQKRLHTTMKANEARRTGVYHVKVTLLDLRNGVMPRTATPVSAGVRRAAQREADQRAGQTKRLRDAPPAKATRQQYRRIARKNSIRTQ